uniref:GDNF-inducible zinc finger protein 1-like n=1 Tax=Myxine glutinosa TaxID=7769 RepID=UPI0035902AE9
MASDEALLLIESPSLAVSLLRALNRMRSCGFLCDITIQTGPDVFPAHRVVLAAASPYFQGLLTPGSHSSSDGCSVVNINEATAKDIHAFLEFVYTGSTTVVVQQLPALKATANLLQCSTLCEACCLAEGPGGSKPDCSAGPMDSATHVAPVLQDVALSNTGVTQAPDEEIGQRQVRPPAEGTVVNIEIGTNPGLANRHNDGRNVKMESLSGVDSDSESESSSNTDDDDHDDDDDDDDDEEHSDCERSKQLSGPVQPEDLCTVMPVDVAVPIRRPLFICGQCSREFQYEKSYTKHMKQTHGVQPDITYCCEACEQHFTSRCNLRSHQRHVHSNDRHFGCDVCAKTFKRQKDLRRHHIQIHEGGRERHYCPSCSKGLSSRSALRLHERTHTGDRPYHCTYCPARFSQPSAIKVHTRIHTGEKPYVCADCGARFTQRHMLIYHTRIHTGERPFMCETCGKSFACKEYLKHHDRVHSGSRPFVCKVCGRTFAQRNSLYQHSKVHTGERPYCCDMCGKQFTQLNALTRHHRIHTGEKPYMCNACGRTFTDKSTLRRHTMVHDKNAPWQSFLTVLNQSKSGKAHAPSSTTRVGSSGPATSAFPGASDVEKGRSALNGTPKGPPEAQLALPAHISGDAPMRSNLRGFSNERSDAVARGPGEAETEDSIAARTESTEKCTAKETGSRTEGEEEHVKTSQLPMMLTIDLSALQASMAAVLNDSL